MLYRFNPFDAWAALPPADRRAAIACGQEISNSKPINITVVAGINGGLDASYLPSITVRKIDPSTGLAKTNCKTTTDLGQALIDGNFDHVGKETWVIETQCPGTPPTRH